MFTGGASLWNLFTLLQPFHFVLMFAPPLVARALPHTPEDGGDGNMWADNWSVAHVTSGDTLSLLPEDSR